MLKRMTLKKELIFLMDSNPPYMKFLFFGLTTNDQKLKGRIAHLRIPEKVLHRFDVCID